MLQSTSKPLNGELAPSSFGNTSNLDNRVYLEEEKLKKWHECENMKSFWYGDDHVGYI